MPQDRSIRTTTFDEGEGLRHHYRDLVDDVVHQLPSSLAVSRRLSTWRPSSDIHETTDAYLVKMELAGMVEEAIDVTLYHDAVVVSGTRRDDDTYETEASFHEAQIRYGPFQAIIVLPAPIDRECAEVRYHNGFLRLRLPKKPPERMHSTPGNAIEAPSNTPDDHAMAQNDTPSLTNENMGDAKHD